MEHLKEPYIFWSVLIIANLVMYAATLAIASLWAKWHKQQNMPITKMDMHTSIQVLLVNILVALPGYILFKTGKIEFVNSHFVLHLLALFFGFDLSMYVLHWVSHSFWPLSNLHNKHHEHRDFNELSLYVMHPMEALLFGALLTISAWMFELNFYSFVSFLVINWLYGVVAHLNSNAQKQMWFFGDHVFHKGHHKHGRYNYGFFTTIWDRLFGSFLNEKSYTTKE